MYVNRYVTTWCLSFVSENIPGKPKSLYSLCNVEITPGSLSRKGAACNKLRIFLILP